MRQHLNWTNTIAFKSGMILLASLAGLVLVEFSYVSLKSLSEENDYREGTMLFQAGDNFQNMGPIFRYVPHSSIRAAAVYTDKHHTKAIKEYDYILTTNNLGLVMTKDIPAGANIKLFVGDSYTEGQGSTPWFYALESQKRTPMDLIPVNGGILGTGPQQWLELTKQLQQDHQLEIVELEIILILADLHRGIWNFTAPEITCLTTAHCDYKQGLQGYNFTSKTDHQLKQDVLSWGISRKRSQEDQGSVTLFQRTKNIIKRSEVISDIYYGLKSMMVLPYHVENNLTALSQLMKIAPGKTHITIVNSKQEVTEVDNNQLLSYSKVGRRLLEWAEANDINYRICPLEEKHFRIYDDHPNEHGYETLRECVIQQ